MVYLTHFSSALLLRRNQSIDSHSKSMDWLLYDSNTGLKWVNFYANGVTRFKYLNSVRYDQTCSKIIFTFWNAHLVLVAPLPVIGQKLYICTKFLEKCKFVSSCFKFWLWILVSYLWYLFLALTFDVLIPDEG